jgi:hypothetical protein
METDLNINVVAQDTQVRIPTHTWIYVVGTDMDVYQTTGGIAIIYVRPNGVIRTHSSTQWEFRKHNG